MVCDHILVARPKKVAAVTPLFYRAKRSRKIKRIRAPRLEEDDERASSCMHPNCQQGIAVKRRERAARVRTLGSEEDMIR
jgi:hypothetical protein